MWLKESKRLVVVDFLHRWYKKKLLKSPEPMTIPKMSALIYAELKDTKDDIPYKSIERYLYEFRDNGFLRCVHKTKDMPGRNGESSLYIFCVRKFEKSYTEDFETIASFKILDRIWTIGKF